MEGPQQVTGLERQLGREGWGLGRVGVGGGGG